MGAGRSDSVKTYFTKKQYKLLFMCGIVDMLHGLIGESKQNV